MSPLLLLLGGGALLALLASKSRTSAAAEDRTPAKRGAEPSSSAPERPETPVSAPEHPETPVSAPEHPETPITHWPIPGAVVTDLKGRRVVRDGFVVPLVEAIARAKVVTAPADWRGDFATFIISFDEKGGSEPGRALLLNMLRAAALFKKIDTLITFDEVNVFTVLFTIREKDVDYWTRENPQLAIIFGPSKTA